MVINMRLSYSGFSLLLIKLCPFSAFDELLALVASLSWSLLVNLCNLLEFMIDLNLDLLYGIKNLVSEQVIWLIPLNGLVEVEILSLKLHMEHLKQGV